MYLHLVRELFVTSLSMPSRYWLDSTGRKSMDLSFWNADLISAKNERLPVETLLDKGRGGRQQTHTTTKAGHPRVGLSAV